MHEKLYLMDRFYVVFCGRLLPALQPVPSSNITHGQIQEITQAVHRALAELKQLHDSDDYTGHKQNEGKWDFKPNARLIVLKSVSEAVDQVIEKSDETAERIGEWRQAVMNIVPLPKELRNRAFGDYRQLDHELRQWQKSDLRKASADHVSNTRPRTQPPTALDWNSPHIKENRARAEARTTASCIHEFWDKFVKIYDAHDKSCDDLGQPGHDAAPAVFTEERLQVYQEPFVHQGFSLQHRLLMPRGRLARQQVAVLK
ncbi:hypothetical protein ACM66B_006236 [Microbotryomycetes sp. NB124-2]